MCMINGNLSFWRKIGVTKVFFFRLPTVLMNSVAKPILYVRDTKVTAILRRVQIQDSALWTDVLKLLKRDAHNIVVHFFLLLGLLRCWCRFCRRKLRYSDWPWYNICFIDGKCYEWNNYHFCCTHLLVKQQITQFLMHLV